MPLPRIALLVWVVVWALLPARAANNFLALKDVKAGMRGIGKTVFSGDHIEDFQVETLGVLENIGPKESLILARLSGGPIETTGVMQGMSGSPVYIDGKLIGAVAMAFPFSKEPIAGIRPIADMLASAEGKAASRAGIRLNSTDVLAALPKRGETLFGASKMIDIATPLSFGGFTREAIERFAPQLRTLGLEPLQGVSGGGRMPAAMGARSALKPGSMISVQLVSGDLSIGADGTVTYIDGERIYAFGHRFLSVGSTDLPFARSEVLTLLPSLSSSFKISSPRELMGAISQDRNTAVAGELGRRAAMVPVSIAVASPNGRRSSYHMEMVDDRFLSPFLLQMSVFSAIDATERTVGSSSFLVKGKIEFHDGAAPVKLDNMYAGDANSAMQVANSAAIPLAYVLQGGFDALHVKQVALEIESFDQKRQMQIDHVFAGRHEAHPGEPIELTIGLAGENGAQVTQKVVYAAPIGLTTGPLYFTVSDANTANLTDFRPMFGVEPSSPGQLISTVNNLKANTKAYVRVWRPDAAFQLHGEDYPAPPASLSLILGRAQSGYGGLSQAYNSKIAELEVDGGGAVITGSKTIQVEIKE
jgi:SpoIVB peptidase S55